MASFTYAVRYWVTATCTTPLRSGCTEDGVESILRHRDGQAFLQGTSLAGALRGWLAASEEPKLVQQLFGSQEQAGQLIVSDGEFSPESTMQSRPRLRINGRTGCHDSGGKFDVAHMGAGSTFEFSLLWTALQKDKAALTAIEQMLAALHNGDIALGAQKTNGFGHVSLNVIKQEYNLQSPAGRTAWIEDTKDGTQLDLTLVAKRQYVVFLLTGYTNGILVKSAAGRSMRKGTFATNIMENGRAVLPGSSIKGAVRSRANAIAQLLRLDESVIEGIFGRGNKVGEDNGRAGLIRFEDAILPEKKQTISRIRIDRFTGGALGTGLFGEEPHSGSITLRIYVPDGQPVACALLLFALRDLGLGLYNLGSDWAVGRGLIAVQEIAVQTPSGAAALRFDKDRNCTVDDSQDIMKSWMKALEAMKCEN